MTYTWEEIQRDWIGATEVSAPPEMIAAILAAFETAERVLGRDHVESYRSVPGLTVTGATPTLSVLDLGIQLMAWRESPIPASSSRS